MDKKKKGGKGKGKGKGKKSAASGMSGVDGGVAGDSLVSHVQEELAKFGWQVAEVLRAMSVALKVGRVCCILKSVLKYVLHAILFSIYLVYAQHAILFSIYLVYV